MGVGLHNKAKTRLVTIFLVIASILLMAVSLTAVFAASIQELTVKYSVYFSSPAKGQSLSFKLSDDGNSYVVTGGDAGTNNVIAIPATYNDKPVSAVDTAAFKNNTSVKTLMIFGSDINIKGEAFKGCSQLTEINVYGNNESSQSLGVVFSDYAFQDCSNLEEIYIKKEVSYLNGNTFSGCVNLNTVTVEDVHTKYYSSENCILEKGTDKLILGSRTGYIPEGVTKIEKGAYSGLTNITSLTIPNSVVEIGEGAFSDCENLTEVNLGTELQNVEHFAFNNCENLIKVNIQDINKYAMIDFEGDHSSPVLYSRNLYLNDTLITNLVIDKATKIGKHAFLNTNSITSVIIGDSVKIIEDSAFNSCIALDGELVIPDSVESIGYAAFNFCIAIDSVVIGDGVKNIDDLAFQKCYELKEVTMGNLIKTVGVDAFNECDKITKVNVEDVNNYAMIDFEDVEANPILYARGIYQNNELVTALNINKATKIGDRAFVSLNINTLTIGSSVKSIGAHAFNSSTFAGALVVPDSVTSVGDHAFNYCVNITSVTIGNGLTNIETSMFQSCIGLQQVTIGSNVNTIMHYVFNGCSNLKNITIPSKVTTIGIMAFNGCGLTNVEFINPNNWYYSSDLSFENPAPITENLADNTIAANCLTNTYKEKLLKQVN